MPSRAVRTESARSVGELLVVAVAAGAVGEALDHHVALRILPEEVRQLLHVAHPARLQLRLVGVEQHIAERDDHAAIGLPRFHVPELRFQLARAVFARPGSAGGRPARRAARHSRPAFALGFALRGFGASLGGLRVALRTVRAALRCDPRCAATPRTGAANTARCAGRTPLRGCAPRGGPLSRSAPAFVTASSAAFCSAVSRAMATSCFAT